MNITFYLKPTIYLALNYIGAVYFGIQPEIEFTFAKDVNFYDTVSSDCAIDYVPTATLLVFIGAELKPLNLYTIWQKEPSLEVAHAVLSSLEGCITHSELTNLETYLGSQTSQWWGNKTQLLDVCMESQQLNNGMSIWPINIPKTGNLLIKIMDSINHNW